MTGIPGMKIKLYADGANIREMIEEYERGIVSGFTTNPTLMKKAGVKSYEEFAKAAVKAIPDLPISFEVFADDLPGMEKEAKKIASWGDNIYVKIPVTNTIGKSTAPVITNLSRAGLQLNVTAILTIDQVIEVCRALDPEIPAIVSVFAGRIADTGRDPVPIMRAAADILSTDKYANLLWASTRELLNLVQAEQCGCDIITITPDILKKVPQIGKDLTQLSLETVRMFYDDAHSAGYQI